ncbi:hypothetical protein ABTZ03_35440 [Kitasatospora sp. NPDC096077]|uniref:hypothetical protein n=1 Tax=Kitasatospora sp. NPDC096077 TaxID=3155544 RepID=UPI00332E6E76
MREVVPDIVDRDVVLGGDPLGDQQAGGFQQLGDIHTLVLDHDVLAAAGDPGPTIEGALARGQSGE